MLSAVALEGANHRFHCHERHKTPASPQLRKAVHATPLLRYAPLAIRVRCQIDALYLRKRHGPIPGGHHDVEECQTIEMDGVLMPHAGTVLSLDHRFDS